MNKYYEVVEVRLDSARIYSHTLEDTKEVYYNLQAAQEEYENKVKSLESFGSKNKGG